MKATVLHSPACIAVLHLHNPSPTDSNSRDNPRVNHTTTLLRILRLQSLLVAAAAVSLATATYAVSEDIPLPQWPQTVDSRASL
jgi:hypothetical protein